MLLIALQSPSRYDPLAPRSQYAALVSGPLKRRPAASAATAVDHAPATRLWLHELI